MELAQRARAAGVESKAPGCGRSRRILPLWPNRFRSNPLSGPRLRRRPRRRRRSKSSTAADVCVIGAGYAGLSTALHLAERGVKTVVLEAHEPGWGGSGRNGGQVIPGLKYDPDELVDEISGARRGARRLRRQHRRRGVRPHRQARDGRAACARRAGSRARIRPTRSRRCAGAPSNGRSAARAAEFLDKAATERHLGTAQYDAGWLDRRGGAIQPLAYARGLARAALDGRRRASMGRAASRRSPATAGAARSTTERGAAVDGRARSSSAPTATPATSCRGCARR